MVDDLVFQEGDQGERVVAVLGQFQCVAGVTADLRGFGEFGQGGCHAFVHVRADQGEGESRRHGPGAVDSVAVLGVAGVELGEGGGALGIAGVGYGEDAGPDAGRVVEVVGVVVAGGGWA